MSAPKVLIGNDVKWSVVFTDELGAAIDPDEVTFTLKAPDETETVFTYGTDEEVVRDDVGEFHIWQAPGSEDDQEGEYTGYFRGTGNIGVRGCAVVDMTNECE